MSTERKRPNRNVGGAPEIAHPDERQGAFIRALFEGTPYSVQDKLKALFNELLPYEKQLIFIYAWFFKMWEELECDDEQAANEARVELQTLLLDGVDQMLRIALSKKESMSKGWAGELLATIGERIRKHDKKLCQANAKYTERKKKLSGKSLSAALFPKGGVQRTTQRELNRAARYRETLLLLKAGCISEREQKSRLSIKQKLPPYVEFDLGKTWKQAARAKKIPEAYWVFAALPDDFSLKSLSQWEKHLSPLIMKKIDVSKMPPLKPRPYDDGQVKYNARTGRPQFIDTGKKNRKRYASDLGIHDTLELLARLNAAGIYY